MLNDGYELNDKRTVKMLTAGVRDFGDLPEIIKRYKTRNTKSFYNHRKQKPAH
jgi:hypothetical protein